jgi:hypothetical protein
MGEGGQTRQAPPSIYAGWNAGNQIRTIGPTAEPLHIGSKERDNRWKKKQHANILVNMRNIRRCSCSTFFSYRILYFWTGGGSSVQSVEISDLMGAGLL